EADWSHHTGHVAITWSSGSEQTTIEQEESSRPDVLRQMLLTLWQGKQPVVRHPSEIAIVGHRVVHGGAKYQQSVLLTPQVREDLRQLIPFAPLQQPANLEGIEVVERLFGSIPQAAVFDTAFHHSMPRVAQTYPGPFAWFEQGIRRYGFHGISHQYCARRSVRLIAQEHSHVRMVTCHLGNGCSLAAIRGGQSVDTTMGFTPLEGLMMGTRSGSIDPAILLYLQRQHGSTPDQIDSLLNHQSGLKGISGLSEDMRVILAASEQGN